MYHEIGGDDAGKINLDWIKESIECQIKNMRQ